MIVSDEWQERMLDLLDNEPIRFWASVIAALRTCLPTLGEEALTLLHAPQSPPLSTILTSLLNEIVQVDREVILILDDCHVISDQAIADSLLFSLEQRLALAKGDLSTAEEALNQLKSLVEQEGFAYHAPWVSTLRVQLWLAEAKLAQAAQWAAQTKTTFCPDTWDPLRRWEVLMLVRVFLAQQQYAQALETLEHWSQYFDRPADIQTAIEWMALYVVALHHSGQREQAVYVAARLSALTEPEGYARLDLDTGEPLMKQALLMLLEAPPEDDPNAVMVDRRVQPGDASGRAGGRKAALRRPFSPARSEVDAYEDIRDRCRPTYLPESLTRLANWGSSVKTQAKKITTLLLLVEFLLH